MCELAEQYELLRWYDQLHEHTNRKYFPLYRCDKRYLVLMGGGGSGKSMFAGQKILQRLVYEPGHRFLVCRKVAKTLSESCIAQLMRQINGFALPEFDSGNFVLNKSEGKLTYLPNRNEILFTGLDDTEKIKSIYGITGIWIEEATELTEQDFSQLDIRLRGETAYYKQIILSFNPISVAHWLKKRFFDQKDPQAKTIVTTYKDNRFLDKAQKRVLERFAQTDPYHYAVYCLGQWGTTGKSVFDTNAITVRLTELPKTQTGDFSVKFNSLCVEEWNFHSNPAGMISIFFPPEPGKKYCIGCDTAGSGIDFFTAQVLEISSGKQVAVFYGKLEEDEYARQIYCLGRLYNNAMIAVEVNYSTYPAKELLRLGYSHQYLRDSGDSASGKPTDKLGFLTNSLTRPQIIGNLIRVMRDGISLLSHKQTLEEMLSFIRTASGRPEAAAGTHDDLVMALAIAYHVRESMLTRVILEENDPDFSGWQQDRIEDYRNASPHQKQQLLMNQDKV